MKTESPKNPQAEDGYGWNTLNHYRCEKNNYILVQQVSGTSTKD